MTSTTPPPIGRIRLSEIADDWSRTGSLNPRLLAAEVAGVLRSIAPDGQALGPQHYSLTMFDLATGAGGLTFGALADYFDSHAGEQPSTSIQTTAGPTPAGAVLLTQPFVARIVSDATQRAATAAGFVIEVAPSPVISGSAQRQTLQPEPPPGSSPEVLAAHQAQQRREGEQSAGEQLDAAFAALQQAEQEKAKLLARDAVREAQRQQALEDAEQARRELIEERRERTKLAAQLQQHAGVIEFMNPDNPLSPEEGRRCVSAWCDLTENGTLDAVAERGLGMGELARRWWKERFGEPATIVVKHLQWMLTCPARKKGGMVARRKRDNG